MNALHLQDYFYAMSWTFVHSIWQGMCIAIAVHLLLLFLPKGSTNTRYLIWTAALSIFLLSAVITFRLYFQDSNNAFTLPKPGLPDSPSVNLLEQSPGVTAGLEIPTNSGGVTNPFFHGLIQYIDQNMYGIFLLWFLGMMLFLLRFLSGVSYIYYIRNHRNFPVDEYWSELLVQLCEKLKIRKQIQLVESSLVQSALVIGHLKPMILFPIGWINKMDVKDVEAVLLHELAHIRRNDFLVNILQSIVEVIFYFNPAVWYLSNRIRDERENCCDEMSIHVCGDPLAYARSLMFIQQMKLEQNPLSLGFLGKNKMQLFKRIQRLLKPESIAHSARERFWVCISVIGVFCLFAISSGFKAKEEPIRQVALQAKKEESLTSKIDSFLLARKVPDGVYTFRDHMLTSTIQVKDNRVILLDINGTALNPQDFPKFEQHFYEIISQHYKPQVTSKSGSNSTTVFDLRNGTSSLITTSREFSGNSSSLKSASSINPSSKTNSIPDHNTAINHADYASMGEGTHVITDKYGYKTIVHNDDEGNSSVEEYFKDKLIRTFTVQADGTGGAYYNHNGSDEVVTQEEDMDEIKAEKLDHLELLEELKQVLQFVRCDSPELQSNLDQLRLQLITLETKINNTLKVPNELPETLAKKCCELKGQTYELVSQIAEVNAQTEDLKQNQNEAQWSGFGASQGNGGSYGSITPIDSGEETWRKQLIKVLEKDGYLSTRQSLRFSWQEGKMKVNGNKVSPTHYEKYKKLFEKIKKVKNYNDREILYFFNMTR